MVSFNVVVFLLTLLSLLSSIAAYAQLEDPTTQQGLKLYTSYHGGDIDSISHRLNQSSERKTRPAHPSRLVVSARKTKSGKLRLEVTIRYDNPRLFVTQTGYKRPPDLVTDATGDSLLFFECLVCGCGIALRLDSQGVVDAEVILPPTQKCA